MQQNRDETRRDDASTKHPDTCSDAIEQLHVSEDVTDPDSVSRASESTIAGRDVAVHLDQGSSPWDDFTDGQVERRDGITIVKRRVNQEMVVVDEIVDPSHEAQYVYADAQTIRANCSCGENAVLVDVGLSAQPIEDVERRIWRLLHARA